MSLSIPKKAGHDSGSDEDRQTSVKIWGSRGSIPRSEPNMTKYGGSTSCVEFVSASGTRAILDMGSGSYSLGQQMISQYFGGGEEGKKRNSGGNILITHTHWDHIQGFPFFVPLFIPGMSWDVYGPRGSAGSIRDSLAGQMQYDYFPVNLNYLGAEIRYHDLTEGMFYLGGGEQNTSTPPPSVAESAANGEGDGKGDGKGDGAAKTGKTDDETGGDSDSDESFCQEIGGDIMVTAHYLHHPCLTLGYRLEDTKTNTTLCYITDHEPFDMRMGTEGYNPSPTRERRTADDKHVQFIQGCDLLLHDSQYTASQYEQKVTWGHSTVEYVVDVALAAGVKRLGLFHHDPMRTDEDIEGLVELATKRMEKRRGDFDSARPDMEIFAAYDKQDILLETNPCENGNHDLVQEVANEGKEATPLEANGGRRTSQHRRESALSDRRGSATSEELFGQVALIFMDDAVAAPIVNVLEASGAVKVYNDAEDALEVAEKVLPSLYIVQHDNGGMTGVEFCRKIRELGDWGKQVPIVIETPDQDTLESIRAEGDEAGVTDYVSKPYSPEYVKTKAHIAMSRSPCRWRKADLPRDEDARLETLQATGLLDSKPEDRYDRLTRIAARTFDVPVVLISLVDKDRQWFKSCEGLCATETPRDQAFCAHAIHRDNVFIIQDATKDDRFADNPLVTGGVVRFYAGMPLSIMGSDNLKHRIGTLCLIDTTPRDLDKDSIRLLQDLAHLVEAEVELSMAEVSRKDRSQSLNTEKIMTETAGSTTGNGGNGAVVVGDAKQGCCATM
mmetsp:Transcript_25134/g.54860  ORF Transcript_25134/g.54860 Transcript_25134/m.54860 type:complete len:784 (+) Transcript_25134:300-2651(+)